MADITKGTISALAVTARTALKAGNDGTGVVTALTATNLA